MTRERFDAAVRRLEPLYEEVGVAAPPYPERFAASFEDQAEAVLDARPAAFSFVFGVPDERVLAAFRDAGIVTLGTATTPDEAVALDEAGIDIVVASGAEAGGHRGAFLAPAEDSLVGTLPLVRIAVEEVQAPGDRRRRHRRREGDRRRARAGCRGRADRHGVPRHRRIGSDRRAQGRTARRRRPAHDAHPRVQRPPRARHPQPARRTAHRRGAIEPYPYQSYLLGPILQAARAQGRTDVVAMWSGQAAPLLEHRSAAALYSPP